MPCPRKLVLAGIATALLPLSWAQDMAEVGTESLVEDDVCSSDENCDVSLRQLRARPRQAEALVEDRTDAQMRFQALLQSNGISSGQQAEVVGESSETGGQLLRLYHQTSPEAGQSILKTGFRTGSGGLCGPAIYFSPSQKDTDVKAVGGRGFIIEAVVDMGRMKHMDGDCDNYMNKEKMKNMGYDSITLDRGGRAECWFLPHCYEYIVYDKSRIKSMKGYAYNGFASWFPWMGPPGWGQPPAGGGRQPSGQPAEVVSQQTSPELEHATQVNAGGGCKSTCDVGGQKATCEDRIKWSVANTFKGKPDACAAAHKQVLSQCAVCGKCSLSSLSCVDHTAKKVPAEGACKATCDVGGQKATCEDRIKWSAANTFKDKPDACAAAHKQVLGQCAVCGSCSLSSLSCA